MSVKLYWNKICPFVQRAWIALLEKSVPTELVFVPLDGDTPAWYKAINPRETVPTLGHGDKIIFESMLIVQYVDESFGQPGSLFPGNALTRYKISYFIDQVGEELIGGLYGYLRDASDANREGAVNALKYINKLAEDQSADGPFFLGATFSAADIALVPFLDRFRTTLGVYRNFDIFEHAPRLRKLLTAALERPSVGQSSQSGDFYLNAYKGYAKQDPPVRLFKLYSSPTCPFAERARLVAALKAVPHEIIDIDLQSPRPDWYLNINAGGSVPTLVGPDGDVVKESALIVQYLAEEFAGCGESLIATNPVDRYDGRFCTDLANNFRYAMFGFLHDPNEASLAELRSALRELSAAMDAKSSTGPFFRGSQISECDVLLVPFLLRLFAVREDFPGLAQLVAEQTRAAALLAAVRSHPIAKDVVRDDAFYREAFLKLFKK
jgi:glutathione S-transferase